MSASGWHCKTAAVLLLAFFLGCTAPSAAVPPLTAKAAQDTLDRWNPNYCKVAELYGLHQPDNGATTLVAYALIVNPSDKAQKPTVYEARFQLLSLPDGNQRWFLTSLITHGFGLSRRQGWDNLIIPVKESAAAAAGSAPASR
jgi:hypothetical protein